MQLATICSGHTDRLHAWIERVEKEGPSLTKTRYDGSINSACKIYQEHPHSRFNKVKHNTRRGYVADLKVIMSTVGARLIRNVTVIDCEHWYEEWRKGDVFIDPQTSTKMIGPERVDRAHNAIAMVRTVIRFMAALRKPECKLLADELSKVKFEKGAAREQELTYRHVRAFIKTAFELADKGIMPRERALYMAIGTAAQFELMLRQKDIIGDWSPRRADQRFPTGISIVDLEDETWSGFFTWESIPGWRWRTRTSKSKYRAPVEFDLSNYDLLFPLLELVPIEARAGAIVKGEHGLPIRYRSYAKWWRQIANAAGIPIEVQSMDARAGGATEAEEALADTSFIQDAMTHAKKETTFRYIRKRTKKIAKLAEIRKQSRVAEDNGTA